MDKRYTETFLFLSRLSRRSDKGFALGFVLCAGVLMAGTGAVMLMRSRSEQDKVVAQQAIAKGKTASDVAVARMQYVLGKYPFISERSKAEWQTDTFDAYAREEIEAQLKNTCIPYTDDDINKRKEEINKYVKDSPEIAIAEANGYFKVIDYKAAIAGEKMGELTLEVKANDGNKLKEAPSKVVVTIPVSQNSAEIPSGPGLWVKNASGLNDIVAAHVWIGSGGDDCSVADDAQKIAEINNNVFGSKGGLNEAITDGELDPGTTFQPALVAEHKFPDEVRLKDIYTATVSDIGATTIPILSTGGSSITGTVGEILDSNLQAHAANFSKKDGTHECGTQMTENENGKDLQVFPRPTDEATRVQIMDDGTTLCIFDYEITNDLRNVEIVARTVNAEGNRQRVIFHLNGNIENNAEIAHIGNDDLGAPDGRGKKATISKVQDVPDCSDPCKPIDFQIWGHNTTSICMNGNKKLHAFVWAPLADMGMMGGGNGKGGLNGTAFINTWGQNCGSNSKSSAHVVQTGEWTDLGLEEPEMIPPKTVGQPANVKFEQFYSAE